MHPMSPTGAESGAETVLAVRQLNRAVAEVLEHGFGLLWVRGEVSNFVRAASGHWYFSLKDDAAAVRAVMFRGRAAHVGFVPKVGDEVEVRARVGLYEPRGDFQLQVQQMRRGGQGSLFEAFLRLKQRLTDEGLTAMERKRQPPAMPRGIAVVTSLRAAALRDVLSTLARRAPHIPVTIFPASVQGAEAPAQLIAALSAAQRSAVADVILLVRGGGSIEDLWAFNHEGLARAIVVSSLPVVCGVGHESDFTIADLVADVRAPTPTAAAELACVARDEHFAQLRRAAVDLQTGHDRHLARFAQRLDRAALRLVSPSERLQRQQERLQNLTHRLRRAQQWQLAQVAQRLGRIDLRRLIPVRALRQAQIDVDRLASRLQQAQLRRSDNRRERVNTLAAQLAALGPEQTLARGYAIVRDAEGKVVRRATDLQVGQAIRVDLAEGAAQAEVKSTRSA